MAIAAGALLPWFSIPHASPPGSTPVVIEALTTPLAWCFRGFSMVVIIVAGIVRYRAQDWRRRWEAHFTALLVVLLFFPYCVSMWCPRIAGEASWLQSQHESLTAASGDIYASQEARDVSWRNHVSIVNNTIDAEVAWLPDGGLRRLTWGRLAEVGDWFGLSSWWATFVRRGWVLALAGTALVLCALCRQSSGSPHAAAVRIVQRAAGLLLSATGLALLPIIATGQLLDQAKEAAQLGDSSKALHALEFAGRLMPSIREDGYVVVQKGLLENALALNTPEARFYRAMLLERQGLASQAERAYLDSLSELDASAGLRREATKALLRRGIDMLNSGKVDGAIYLLGAVVESDPCNIKANYALQLAYLRHGDIVTLIQLRQRMGAIYQQFNSPIKETVLADSSEMLAFGHYRDGDLAAAMAAWREARR